MAPPCSAGRSGLPISCSSIGQLRGQLVAAALEGDAEVAGVGHGRDHARERGVAALLDHLHRLGARRGISRAASTVKAPAAAATGSSIDSVQAKARTKATVRVMR